MTTGVLRRRWMAFVQLALLVTVAASPCAAQRLAVEGVLGSSSHPLLDGPRGIAGSLTFPGESRIRFMLVAERLTSETSGTGVVCAGLIDPTRCPNEAFEQDARLSGAGVAVAVRLVRLPVAEVELMPRLLFGRARTVTQGLESGNELAADNGQVAFSLGAELRIIPARQLPLDVFIGGSAGGIGPLGTESAFDRYRPFDSWETLHRVYAGAAFRWGRASGVSRSATPR